MQVYKYARMQVCKYASMQECKHSSMQVYKWVYGWEDQFKNKTNLSQNWVEVKAELGKNSCEQKLVIVLNQISYEHQLYFSSSNHLN